jgi:hypothetical protein
MSAGMSKHTPGRPVAGFPDYFVAEDGRVFSATNWRGYGVREIAPVVDEHGYLKVRLTLNGRRLKRSVHRLVALAWLSGTPQHDVRHLDGNKHNNHASNLAWGSQRDNAADRERHGRTSRGPKHSAAIRAGLEACYG